MRILTCLCFLTLLLTACTPPATPQLAPVTGTLSATDTPTVTASATATATSTNAPAPTETSTPLPSVDSLKASVTADLLSCRYGPGSEYLFLYGLRAGANIKLIGRTDGNNWLYVDGKNPCWVNAKFIAIQGDPQTLRVVYPNEAKLPVSPYYLPTTVLSVTRTGNSITVKWLDIPLRAGDEEDESMQHYIIEVWRCEGGKFFFDPLATNETSIIFVDEPGCSQPSFGRVFVQEKHGFAGPAEIPWPAPNRVPESIQLREN